MTTALILAAFAQVCLNLFAVVRLGLARVACIQRGELKMAQIALDDSLWPEPILKLQANVRNQFETPMLFFAGVAVALAVGAVNWTVVIFAWVYVVSRMVHHVIHVGSNRVGRRFQAFAIGLLSLGGLWTALVIDAIFL